MYLIRGSTGEDSSESVKRKGSAGEGLSERVQRRGSAVEGPLEKMTTGKEDSFQNEP